MSKYFPIRTETACALKWSWNTLRLYSGATNSCHRVNSEEITVDTFDTFHNTAKKISDRQLMLAGQWPTGGCEFCSDVERAGGSSDRMFHLKVPDQYPLELDQDATLTHVNPTILEIYLDNVCNMSCLYCYNGASSQIEQENNRYGAFRRDGIVIENVTRRHPNRDELIEKFWAWMEINSQSLRRFHILGGEPFYQKAFDRCLTFLETHEHPDMEFNVVSNLMIEHERFVEQIERIKRMTAQRRIKRFDLTASIDCWGPEQEYVRHGLDLTVWRRNFEYLVQQKWIYLNINQTLTTLTIKTIPELIQYLQEKRQVRKIGHYMSTPVYTHSFLHPKIFGRGYFLNELTEALDLMPSSNWQELEARTFLQGVITHLESCERDQTEIDRLAIYLDEIDRRRRLDWRQTFAWLPKEISV